MATELLILMARYPTPGKVKTRLARDIGAAAAAQWYRQMLFHFRREFSRTRYDVEWRFTPARSPFRRLFRLNRRHGRPQPAGALGDRMQAAFADAFARGYRRVVLIGTDAPEVSRATVRRRLASAAHAPGCAPAHARRRLRAGGAVRAGGHLQQDTVEHGPRSQAHPPPPPPVAAAPRPNCR